eukprot:jgi/Orpsp1_1/1178614/evm.model.c7180000066058.1
MKNSYIIYSKYINTIFILIPCHCFFIFLGILNASPIPCSNTLLGTVIHGHDNTKINGSVSGNLGAGVGAGAGIEIGISGGINGKANVGVGINDKIGGKIGIG